MDGQNQKKSAGYLLYQGELCFSIIIDPQLLKRALPSCSISNNLLYINEIEEGKKRALSLAQKLMDRCTAKISRYQPNFPKSSTGIHRTDFRKRISNFA